MQCLRCQGLLIAVQMRDMDSPRCLVGVASSVVQRRTQGLKPIERVTINRFGTVRASLGLLQPSLG
jgi:hypothetical protein